MKRSAIKPSTSIRCPRCSGELELLPGGVIWECIGTCNYAFHPNELIREGVPASLISRSKRQANRDEKEADNETV